MTKDYEITVFTMGHCPSCVTLKKWLDKQGIAFVEKDIVTNEKYEEEFNEKGLRYTPTTFITMDNETHQFIGEIKTKKFLSAELISQ